MLLGPAQVAARALGSGDTGEEMKKLGSRGLAVGAFAAAIGVVSAQSVTLTGANWYTLDAARHYSGGYANTYGGDTYSRNLYVTENQTVGLGPLLNSGNLTTLPTRIQIDLSTPGTNTFQMYCNGESSGITPYWGLNLFFNNNDLQPGISVQNIVDTPGFTAIDPIGTPTLNPLTMGLVTSTSGGSGSQTVALFGNAQIRLTAYSTWSTDHYNVDRVDNFTDDGGLGNGAKDQVIEFTLQTTPVPEPCTMLILGTSSILVAFRRRLTATRR
ncbi:MAG: PEP-CTERM sorting domain-containing protein [Fimbriimonadales bacterium]